MKLNSIPAFLLLMGLLCVHPLFADAQDAGTKNESEASKALDNWILDLSSDDSKKQLAAAWAIENIGPKAQKAVPGLIIALNDSNSKVALAAQRALVKIAPADLKELTSVLKNPKKEVRLLGVQIFHDLGAKGSGATEALIGVLSDEENLIRQSAKMTLGVLGTKALPALKKGLNSKKAFVRVSCAYACLKIDPKNALCLALLSKELKSEEKWIRREAAGALLDLSPQGDALFALLQKAFHDPSCTVRETVLRALGQYGAKAAPVLIAALNDKSLKLREVAVRSLDALPRKNEKVIRGFLTALRDSKPSVRQLAKQALNNLELRNLDVFIDVLGEEDRTAHGYILSTFLSLDVAPPKALPALLKLIKGKGGPVPQRAIRVLSLMGPKAEAAIPDLYKILEEDRWLRREARMALQNIGFQSESAILGVLKILKSKDLNLRREGEFLCGCIGFRSVTFAPHFARALEDESATVRDASLRVLRRMGAPAKVAVPALLKLLVDPRVRRKTYIQLALIQMGRAAVPGLMKVLGHKDISTRIDALQILRMMGSASEAAVPSLVSLLKVENSGFRIQLLRTLKQIGPKAKAAIPSLMALLEKVSPGERSYALAAIVSIGPKTIGIVPALLKYGESETTRSSAARLLAELGPTVGPALLAALKSPSLNRRACAAEALGLLNPKAAEALTPLISAISDKSAVVRSAAIKSLGNFGADAAAGVPELVTQLKAGLNFEKKDIVITLKSIGPKAAQAIPLLREELNSKESPLSKTLLLGALVQIGGETIELQPLFTEALKDKDPVIRRALSSSFGKIGSRAEALAPVFLELLNDPDSTVRSDAKKILRSLRPRSLEQLSTYLAALNGSNLTVASAGLRLIAAMGPKAKKVVPELMLSFKTARTSLKREILLALGKLGKDSEDVRRFLFDKLSDRRCQASALEAVLSLGDFSAEDLEKIYEYLPNWGAQRIFVKADALGVSFLLARLEKEDRQKKKVILETLRSFKSKAEPALPVLLKLLEVKDLKMTALAGLASIRSKPKLVVPLLLKELKQRLALSEGRRLGASDFALIRRLVENLGGLGSEATEAVPVLIRLVGGQELRLRRPAIIALSRIGAGARPALPALFNALDGISGSERVFALTAIIEIGSGDRATLLKALEMATRDPRGRLYERALRQLTFIESGAMCIVDTLIKRLQEQPDIRDQLINVLIGIRPAAKLALPALRGLPDDTRWTRLTRWAIQSLEERLKKDASNNKK